MIMKEFHHKKIAVVSGGFDPLHPGHVFMFQEAKRHGEVVVAGVNSDDWLKRKKGRPFMEFGDRLQIVQTNQFVDLAVGFEDDDDTAIDLIYKVSKIFSSSYIVFCNGGDRALDNTPEFNHFDGDSRFLFEFGVGGSYKYASSSELLENWKLAPLAE